MGRAFTLAELLVAIIIIAVIAAVAVPMIAHGTLNAKETAIRRDLKVLREAAGRFYQDTGVYPRSVAALGRRVAPSRGFNAMGQLQAIPAASFRGPYIVAVPKSPISGASYRVVVPLVDGKIIHHPAGRASDGSNYYNW